MADGPSSVSTTNSRPVYPPVPSLPPEYQVRPAHLAPVAESPLTGLAAHPFRKRSIWFELWKSKLAFILFAGSTTFIYFDYQRTQRYKTQKLLNAASEAKKLAAKN